MIPELLESVWPRVLIPMVSVLVIMIVLYVHLSKRFCFRNSDSRTCWCCKRSSSSSSKLTSRSRISKELINSFSLNHDAGSDDEDNLNDPALGASKLSSYLGEHKKYNKLIDCHKASVPFYGPPMATTPTTSAGGNARRHGRCIQRQHSMYHHEDEGYESHYNHKHKSRNLLKQQAIYTSLALKNGTKNFENMLLSKSKIDGKQAERNDLISLAEKGRIGKQASTDGSASSETGSTEDAILDKKAMFKRIKTVSSETTDSKDTTDGLKYQPFNSFGLDNYESDTQSSNLPDFSPNTTLSESNMALATKYGKLEISFAYDAPTKRLCIVVIQANEIPYKEARTGVNQIYVHVLLLPNKKQKYRTKPKPIFCPVFNESFTFNRIGAEEIVNLGLKFKVYSMGFAKKAHLVGESRILFAYIKPQQQETKLWFTLDFIKKSEQSDLRSDVSSLARTDSTSSQSLHTVLPELLLGLAYNGTTGRLNVCIIKGSQLCNSSSRACHTYVKLSLISSNGQEIEHCKTNVVRAQPNPDYKENFVFQVALFQLPDVTLTIAVYNKRNIKRKQLVGWISLGYNSSGDEELSHWNDMRDSKGEQVGRWHTLLQS